MTAGFRLLCVAALSAAVMLSMGVARGAEPVRSWPELEPLVRGALAEYLDTAEIDRLLASRQVREALLETFAGYDGLEDALTISVEGGMLALRVVLGELREQCITTEAAGESGEPVTTCTPVVEQGDDRELELPSSLWSAPPPPKKPKKPKKKRPVEELCPPPEEPPPSVLRRPRPPRQPGAIVDPELAELLLKNAELRSAAASSSSWHDPLAPKVPLLDRALARDADAPEEPPPPDTPTRADANLSDPFGPGRLVTAWPVPDFFARPPDEDPPLLDLPAPTEACERSFRAGPAAPTPPAHGCYLRLAQHRRLDRRGVHEVASYLAGISFLRPFAEAAMESEAERAAASRAADTIWLYDWLEWQLAHPGGLAAAMKAVVPDERRLLRRYLRRIWSDRAFARYERTVTAIYERHFGDLYPESRTASGWPDSARYPGAWLWCRNWHAHAETVNETASRAAYLDLAPREKRWLDLTR